MRVLGRGDVPLARLPREALPDRGGDRVERDLAGQRREGAEQRGVRQRAAELLAREVGRRHGRAPAGREALDVLAEPEVRERAARVDSR